MITKICGQHSKRFRPNYKTVDKKSKPQIICDSFIIVDVPWPTLKLSRSGCQILSS